MRFAWIHVEKATYAVRRLCRVLAVTPSGYYALDAPAAEPAGAGQRPAAGTHPGHPCRQPGHLWEPACPRAAHARGLCGGAGACRATVAGHGARGPARETRPAHHRQHARPARRPQRARASLRGRPSKPAVDHRHHLHLDVGGGWLYLAVVLDLYARRGVGWAVQPHLQTELALEALQLALGRRVPAPGLVHHSDRGCQAGFKGSSQHVLTGVRVAVR